VWRVHPRIFLDALAVVLSLGRVERRDVKHVGLCALLREERQCNLVDKNKFIYGRFGIVEQTDKTQATGTLRGAGVDLAFLQTWITEDALLGFSGDLVEVDLLIWTRFDAVAVTLATVLV